MLVCLMQYASIEKKNATKIGYYWLWGRRCYVLAATAFATAAAVVATVIAVVTN